MTDEPEDPWERSEASAVHLIDAADAPAGMRMIEARMMISFFIL
jgi:hypothetical protein